MAALDVFHPVARLPEPWGVAVEGGAEPWVFPRHVIFGLVDVDVEHEVIDAFAKQLLTTRFEDVGVVAGDEFAGEGLGVNSAFSVDVPGGACGATFNGTHLVGRPELATNHIGVGSVDEKLTGESPVAVVLAPERQVVFVSDISESADVVLRNHIGHRAAQVPEELIGFFGAIDHPAGHDGQKGDRAVAVAFGKLGGKAIGPVLGSDLVAVDCDAFEGGLFRRGHVFHQLTERRVEVVAGVFFAHFVALQSCRFRCSRAIFRACGDHTEVDDVPVTFG